MSDEAIIAASDGRLTMAEVAGLSYTMAWNNVPFEIMMAFTKACGVDFDDREALQRHAKMMDQGRFGYLRKSSLWKTHFERIYREWTRHLNH